jgi:hypothetical protein
MRRSKVRKPDLNVSDDSISAAHDARNYKRHSWPVICQQYAPRQGIGDGPVRDAIFELETNRFGAQDPAPLPGKR